MDASVQKFGAWAPAGKHTSTATTSCTRYYSHAGATIGSRTNTALTWLSPDHQGTGNLAINASNQQATIRRQTPYGTERGTTNGPWPNSRGFVGGVNDNTGLTHLGAREYDPVNGRFISVDPIQDLADPQQWNGYSYANNNPVTLSDPSGLRPDDLFYGEDAAERIDRDRSKGAGGGGSPSCSGRYCVGSPVRPAEHTEADDDFRHDPLATATIADYYNLSKWRTMLNACTVSSLVNFGKCADMHQAPGFYAHYLEATGTSIEFDYEDGYDQDASIRDDVNKEILQAQKAAEALAKGQGSKFSITGRSRNIARNPNTFEWQKVLGSYDMWSSADVEVKGKQITMRIRVNAYDRYNFNRGAKDIQTDKPDDANGRFAVLGWAKSFNTSGSLERTVTWTVGSSSAAVVSGGGSRW